MAIASSTCPHCGSGMYLSPGDALPWVCVNCRYETSDPAVYQGRPSNAPMMLTLRGTGTNDVDAELVNALREIDAIFRSGSKFDLIRGLRSPEGLGVGPLPWWRVGKITYAMRGTVVAIESMVAGYNF